MGDVLPDDAMVAGASAEVPVHASLEAKTAEDASMEEHLRQLLRAVKERENQEQFDAATPALQRRGRPSKQGCQFIKSVRFTEGVRFKVTAL